MSTTSATFGRGRRRGAFEALTKGWTPLALRLVDTVSRWRVEEAALTQGQVNECVPLQEVAPEAFPSAGCSTDWQR